MPNAIIITSPGGAENLKYVEIPYKAPAPTEVRIKTTCIGVNYIDIYQRNGLYPVGAPFIPGVEAAGIIEEIGSNTEGVAVGDRVIFGTSPTPAFAYATHVNIDQKYTIKIPFDISDEALLSLFMKGLTAHYLLCRIFYVLPDNTILVHSAAGGVGTYMCQWASFIGAKIIGTVSSDEKAKWATANGCTHVINTSRQDFVKATMEITGGKGVPVVYDAVGKDTFMQSLECLAPMGLMVSYGQSSGAIPPVDLSVLSKKSLFLTRPSVFNYKADRNELVLTAMELFEGMRQNVLKPRIGQKFALKDAAHAHKLLESRQTMGSILLIP